MATTTKTTTTKKRTTKTKTEWSIPKLQPNPFCLLYTSDAADD